MAADDRLPSSESRLLTGWGRTAATRAEVFTPASAQEVEILLKDHGERGAIPRGLGRSYGDAAQNSGGRVLDMTSLARVREFDVAAGVITVDAGLSLDTLMRMALPFGWFVPVTPGTRFVTVGGAIAADIHGKNHHCDGGFCDHVRSLVLRTPTGETVTASAEQQADVFWATAGGMGLTGVVLEATLQLLAVETSLVSVDTERATDLDDVMARMDREDDRYRYSVAWIDLLATGPRMGRSVLTRGDHAALEELPPSRRADPLRFAPSSRLAAPAWVPSGLLRHSTVRAFNELWFRKAPREERRRLEPLHVFFHPLDGVREWNRIYGRRGFLQYQFVVPFGEEETVRGIVERLSGAGCASFLAVLKRFGPERGLLSFPLAGWTLTLDIPSSLPDLAPLLDDLDRVVADAGGRVYLAKDSRLRPDLLAEMYPKLDRWRAVRGRLDPHGVMRSDLARRLQLV